MIISTHTFTIHRQTVYYALHCHQMESLLSLLHLDDLGRLEKELRKDENKSTEAEWEKHGWDPKDTSPNITLSDHTTVVCICTYMMYTSD